MRAPAPKRSSDKEAAAIKEASQRLCRLFINVVSWSERGAGTNNPKTEFESALALVECFVNDSALDGHPLAKTVRKAAIPILRRARPPIGRHGRHADLNSSRDRVIAETVEAICKQHGLYATRNEATKDENRVSASWVVSKALMSTVLEHRRAYRRLIEEQNADPAWINECRKFVDKLFLSEARVEDIFKRNRS
jgi:hypothetical protein